MIQLSTSQNLAISQGESGLFAWLAKLPAESIERLRLINTSTNSSRHIILALAFGLYDPHIRRLNRTITGMLLSRLKAERAGKSALVAQINEFMEEMHVSIDRVTGVERSSEHGGEVCGRAPRRS